MFVANYQLAYQGPNTLKGQIDANLKKTSKGTTMNYCYCDGAFHYRIQ